jgi:hypothetical protein
MILIRPYSFLNSIHSYLHLDISIKSYDLYDKFEFDYKLNYILLAVGYSKLLLSFKARIMNSYYVSPRGTL